MSADRRASASYGVGDDLDVLVSSVACLCAGAARGPTEPVRGDFLQLRGVKLVAVVRERKGGRRGEESTNFPVFNGADRVLKLIGALYQRPRFGDRPRRLGETDGKWGEACDRRERSGRKGLPMVCLVRSDGHETLLRSVDELLETARPHGVRHAYIPLTDDSPNRNSCTEFDPLTTGDVENVREILKEARNELVNSPKVRGSRLRFPLFTLIVWLMNYELKADDPNQDRTLLKEIQKLGINQRLHAGLQTIDDKLSADKWWWKVPLWILRILTILTFSIAATGQVPILSGQYRWFLLQPYLAPEMSGSFVRFAERLTKGEWTKEAPEYVARLLVNAFLEDLRRAYRLFPWQVWRKRRMTYPALLLDNITMTNGGYTVLRLINDIRNQNGRFDPLLVISASRNVPPDAGRDPARPRYVAANSLNGYNTWQNVLLADRRARRDNAWYLPIRIPGAPTESERDTTEQKLGSIDGFTVGRRESRPLWWGTRRARIGVPTVVAAIVVTVLAVNDENWRGSHCSTANSSLTWTGSECIGVSDGTYDLFQPSDQSIRQVEHTILTQNQRAEQLHQTFPQRPYITLVDVEALTSSTNTSTGLTAERESLEGFAVAQWRQLNKSAISDPIVRILIANAGQGMRQGKLIGKQLGAMAAQDPSLVGVIGLDMSSQPTEDTITALANAGIPMVAATLSADNLADANPMYFQVAPQNRREAAVVEAFAQQQLTTSAMIPHSMRVYYSDDETDIYSTNLRQDALETFRKKGFQVDARAFTPSNSGGVQAVHKQFGDIPVGNAAAAGRDTCSYNGFAYFTGRGVPDFGDFISGAAQCGSKAVVIGDDDVTRYVADQNAREQNRALPYYYVSFALAPITNPQGSGQDFYGDLKNSLFQFEQTTTGRSLDGHAALSYDAAQVMIVATEYLREDSLTIPVTPGSVWREITAIHTSPTGQPHANNFIEGVTGAIDYGGDITRHVPEDKPVAILRVHDGEVDPKLSGFCGRATDSPPSSWCPTTG